MNNNASYALGAIIAMASVNAAYSQSAVTAKSDNTEPDTGKLVEIVVTAQRRSENLQSVPIAVTAVTQASLERNVVTDVTDLATVVPGLHVSNEIGYVTSQLRGVGTNLLSVGFENPIAIYVDGVYYASPNASLLNFSNIDRVEVLKGPQGTLFGRNATGGLIQVITKDPSHELGGSAELSYGNYDTRNASFYLTGGITDTIAMDVAVQGGDQGEGWGRNVYNGQEDYKVDHNVSARSKVVFQSEGMRVALSVDYTDFKNSLNTQTLYPGTYTGLGGGPLNLVGRYDSDTNVQPYMENASGGVSLQASQDLQFATISSVTAYRKSHFLNITDIDETPEPAQAFRLAQRDLQFSEELQLLSTKSGPLTWVGGLYFFRADGKWDPFTVTLGPPTPVPLPLNVSSYDDIGTKSEAVYAQATLALGGDTNLTLGGRYTHEIRSRIGTQVTTAAADGEIPVAPGVVVPVAAGDALGPPVLFAKSDLTYDRFTPRIALDHELAPDVLGYVSFNRGFKSGGYNPAVYGESLLVGYTYAPEQLDAYEIGVKSTLFEQRVRLNGAAFFYNYKDMQLPFIIDTTVVTINGAKARIYGVDGDAEFRVTSALRLTGGMQVISDEYLSFPAAPIGTAQGGVPLTVGSAKGHHLNFVPSVTVNSGVDYTVDDIANGSVNFGVNAAFDGGFYTSPDNIRRQPAFVLLNASATWTSRTNWSVGAYGKNLANYRTIASLQENQYGSQPTEWAAPRTYGASVGYKF